MSRKRPKQSIPKTAFGTMLREAQRAAPMGTERYRTVVLGALPVSRTVVMDPDQAMAAMGAISDAASVHELAQMVRPPFPETLIDLGAGLGDGEVRIRGALFCDVGISAGLEVMFLVERRGTPTILYSAAHLLRDHTAEGADAIASEHRQRLEELEAHGTVDDVEIEHKRNELIDVLRGVVQAEQDMEDTKGRMADTVKRLESSPAMLRVLAAPYAALAVLESVNVELVESTQPYQRGHVGHGTPKFDVYIRQSKRRAGGEGFGDSNYSHRFEVRGNFAHHFETTAAGTPNRLFEKWSTERPEKVVQVGGRPCIRIWRPPYVKGPEDQPLVPKIRHLAGSIVL